ncbi:MAG: DUF2341 domain-containing protein [Nitrososphaerota archaeon]
MAALNKKVLNNILILIFISCFLINIFPVSALIKNVFAASYLREKWRISYYIQTHIGPVAEDLNGDGVLDIVITGVRRRDGKGIVAAINGSNGAILWEFEDNYIGTHHPCDIVDLNNDDLKEVVVAAYYPLVLHGRNGTLYWKITKAVAYQNFNAIFDIDGDGYSEIFINSGHGPGAGYDYITCLDYQGNVKYRAWCWHPCYGGLTIGDANFDGRFEIYQGDRRVTYSATTDKYKGGGMGIRALDADTLTPLWNDPTILCSSHCPILADVDKDGILDVIVADQSNNGIAVLNSTDGSVLTTGGVYRKGSTNMRAHSQPTVYDIDGDGNLEFISCREYSPVKIWDLYEWKLDAVLPVNCYEPPKLGDVTGDGQLDIIAVNNTEIYIFSYNNSSREYELVDYVSRLNWGCNAFTLVQDVDGDGLNELVVTSMGGDVYCFDTPAPTPTPRPRSGIQFYSEYRWGAAIYVAPPIPSRPVIKNEKPLDGSLNQPLNPTLSIQAINFQGHKMNIVFTTNASGEWENIQIYENVTNGVYSVNTSNMNQPGTTYFWSVNCTDIETGKWTYKIYRFTTCSTSPMQENPILILDTFTGNLVCYNQSTLDPDGDKVTNIYNWFVNDVSLTNLNLPFDTKISNNPLATEMLLYEGFENGLNDWQTTDWNLVTDQKRSGSYSIRADSTSTYLLSPKIDTSNAEYITVSFWYRDRGVDKWDSYLQFWDGTSYVTILDLGDTKPEDTWHYFSIQTYQRKYLIPDFHIRFDGVEIDSGEYLWIDDLIITTTPRSKDYSSYKNHATIHGATWTSNGVSGGAYVLDGLNDYIRIQDDPSLGGDGTWSEITIEFWIKPLTKHNGAIIIAKKEPQLNIGSYMIGFEATNRLFFGINSTYDNKWHSVSNSSTVLEVGKWHHVVCVYKSGLGLSIYINGTERASMPLNGNIAPNPGISVNGAPLFIGWDGGSDYRNPRSRWLNAYIDEVRIYPRALSQSQILQRFLEIGNRSSSTIVSEETANGESWKCQVIPNDSFSDGEPKFSNTIIIGSLNIQHTLFISISGEGTTNPAPYTTHQFNEGTTITLTALPSIGWSFKYWLINDSIIIETNPYNLTISSDYNITAIFAQNNYTLTIIKIGEGSVSIDPEKSIYRHGENVTLTAIPENGYEFAGWTGDIIGNEIQVKITMTKNMSVTVHFTLRRYIINAMVNGIGGTIEPSGLIIAYYGENITFTITPNTGYHIHDVIVDEESQGPIETYTFNFVTANHTIVAQFAPNEYALNIIMRGEGQVAKDPNKEMYVYGENVTLTATAKLGWSFTGWSGDVSGNETTITITIKANITVYATFIPNNWWNRDWQYRRTIVINRTKVSEELINFTVLIEIFDSSLFGKTQLDGDDFVFTDANQTKLDHQIEYYNYTCGHLIVWVKVPCLSSTMDTTLYMYYGNLACENQQNPTAVWDTNYKLVLHLNEQTGIHYDSTVNRNNGAPLNGVQQGVNTKIDGGDTFDGINDYIQIPHSNTLTGYTEALTISFWVKFEDTTRRQTILGKYDTAGNQRGWFVDYNPVNRPTRPLGFYASWDGTNYHEWWANFIPQASVWYHITIIWEANNIPKFYINGVQVLAVGKYKTATIPQIYNNSVPLLIGKCPYDATRYFKGSLDEITISSTARPTNWIQTAYNNQLSPATFYTIGAEETIGT